MRLFDLSKEESFKLYEITGETAVGSGIERSEGVGILYIIQGNCDLQVGCQHLHANNSSVVTIFPGDLVSFQSISVDFDAQLLLLRGSIFQEILFRMEHYMVAIMGKQRLNELHDNPLSNKFILNTYSNLSLLQSIESGNYIYEQLQCQVRSLLLFLCEQIKTVPAHQQIRYTRIEEHFRKFIQLLGQNYRKSRVVLYYADLMNITPKYLNFICNSVAQRKCKSIIDGLVIMQLKNELMMTDKTIQEITYEYNFPNQSFFGSYFKRFAGMSPSAFRSSVENQIVKDFTAKK